MLFSLLFLYSIHFVISLNSREDLSITKYSQIGCLILKSDKQFIVDNIQENYLLPHQTFSSPSMTIELCFRFCRQWIILLYHNQTTCICSYIINKPYEFNEYLGEFLPMNNCTSNHVQIFSLTENIYLLPPLLSSTSDDWSLDGCYYLHDIQTIRVNSWLTDVDFNRAIDLCRKHCQIINENNTYSYFLSRKKSCYCLPIKFSQRIKTMAIRKPLKHCSFLPNICQGFSSSCKKYYSETNADTVIKIDVHRYCLSTDSSSFAFDRIFYMCFKTVLLHTQMTISTINYAQKCVPLLIKTYEQWIYLIQSSWITYSKIFILIHRNSTYIFDDLFKYNNLTLSSNELCITIIRTDTNEILYELIQCSVAHSPSSVLCGQNPLPSAVLYEEEFKIINNASVISIDEILSCPPEFTLFNKICYYIHSSFIYNIQTSERLCYNQYVNSTLVKFDVHEWGNINATKFLGRAFNDILLEFFYYLLEKKLLISSIKESNKRYWLQLLLGDKNDPNECVIRYFTRPLGRFSLFYRCNMGGYPICQTEPIRTVLPKTIPINQTIHIMSNLPLELTTELTIATTQITAFNSTKLLIVSNQTVVPIDENCTIYPCAIGDDLLNNKTKLSPESGNNTSIGSTREQSNKRYAKYQPLILILSGPILGLIVLFVGICSLIWYVRRKHRPHSRCSSIVGGRRTKRSSTTATTGDIPHAPAVLYTPLKSLRTSLHETDIILPLDNLLPNDDYIEFLPATKVPLINN